MRMLRRYALVILWGSLVTTPDTVLAQLVTYNPANPAEAARTQGPYTIGMLFQVGVTPITITHLGAQDVDNPNANEVVQDGTRAFGDDEGFVTNGNVAVGLWDSSGTNLLASVLVTDTSLQINSWRYEPINSGPLTLAANTQYLIGARVGSGIEAFLDEGLAANDIFSFNGITILQNRFSDIGGALPAPLQDGTGTLGRWAAANAIAVPEPGSLAVVALVAIAMLFTRRRKAA